MVHDDINHLGPGVPGFQASEQIHRRLGVNRLVKPHRRLQRLDVESRPASAQPRYTHPEADPGCRLGGTGRNSGGRSSRPAGGFRRSGPLTIPWPEQSRPSAGLPAAGLAKSGEPFRAGQFPFWLTYIPSYQLLTN